MFQTDLWHLTQIGVSGDDRCVAVSTETQFVFYDTLTLTDREREHPQPYNKNKGHKYSTFAFTPDGWGICFIDNTAHRAIQRQTYQNYLLEHDFNKVIDKLRIADDNKCFVNLEEKKVPESKMGPAMVLTMAMLYYTRHPWQHDGIGYDNITIFAFDGRAFYAYANNVGCGDTTTLQKITYEYGPTSMIFTRTPLLEFIIVDPIVRGIFSRNCTRMIAITRVGIAGVFDFNTNTCTPNASEYGFGNNTYIYLLTAGFAPDGASIIMIFVDKIVFVDIQTWKAHKIVELPQVACDACVSNTGRVIVTRHRIDSMSVFKIWTVNESAVNTLAKQLEEIKM
jgi:hypothetical protein